MASFSSHPFGRENEVSLKKLWQCFCNFLFLGQWECAKCCINELLEQKELLEIDVLECLKCVAAHPETFW